MSAALAQDWPTRPVHLITPYAPGGTSDVTARVVAEKLSDRLKVPVVVENRPGANTRLATRSVARAAPDGYTLLWAAGSHTINPALYDDLGYDTRKDFAPIIHAYVLPVVFVVPSSSPARTVAEYVSLARRDKHFATVGHSGTGSAPHLALELLGEATGISFNEIGYKGDAPAMNDLIGNQMPAAMLSIGTPVPYVRAGRLRALAVASETRAPLLPDVPTFKEAGLPQVDAFAWFGLLAPAGTPVAITERLNREVNAILTQPDVQAVTNNTGSVPLGGSVEDFRSFIDKDIDKWTRLAKQRNIKVD
jgi:tripartite-type tricarboxylate transporter receptor subunit TctC